MPSIGFKNVYYDMYHSKIHHWYTDENGKSRHEEIDINQEYYLYDPEKKSEIKDIYGLPVIKATADTYNDLKMVLEGGIKTCEAKISQEIKFLQKTYGNQIIKSDIKNFNIGIIDIEIQSECFPKVEEAKYPINLISIWLNNSNQVFTFGTQEYTGDSETVKNYIYCVDEKILLRKFIKFFRKCRLNIVSGWNIKKFDLPYIIKRCEQLEIEDSLSPLNIYRENYQREGYHIEGGGYQLAGLSTLDYIDLYKNFTRTKREKYGLDAICIEEIKEGKVKYEGTINDLWKTDWNKFVEYNIQDVLLVKKLDDKLRLFELAISMCHDSLIPFEKVFSSINLITGQVLKYCHKKNIVIPDRQGSNEHVDFEGAYVMAKEGYYKWCENFDIVSMYPHIVMGFNLSPETLVLNPMDNSDLIKTPIEEIYYKKQQGILPEITKNIFDRRVENVIKHDICIGIEENLNDKEISKRYKLDLKQIPYYKAQIEEEKGTASYYDRNQYVLKIYINSIYGATGSPFFCLYNPDISRTVTACGRDLIKFLTNKTNNYLRENWHLIVEDLIPEYVRALYIEPLKNDVVCLIDTDSGHICFSEMINTIGFEFKDNKEFLEFTHIINDRLFNPFYDRILNLYAARYGIKQIFKFKPEKIITKKLIIAMKKYVDEIIEKKGQRFDPPKLSITGIEIVRTDTPKFCREKIKEIVKMIFDTEDKNKVLDHLRKTKQEFFKCSPDEIAKPKGIKEYNKYAKPIQEYLDNGLSYVKGIPQHNRAGINYNYVTAFYNLPLKYIDDKEKIKYVYLYDNNFINQDVIAMISKWPEKFDELFTVNYEKQWEITFEDVVNRFFKALNWSKINLESNSLEDMFN